MFHSLNRVDIDHVCGCSLIVSMRQADAFPVSLYLLLLTRILFLFKSPIESPGGASVVVFEIPVYWTAVFRKPTSDFESLNS